MLRKIVAAVILVPLAIVIIAFAVANRRDVTVSLDPFSSDIPAASVTQPLFVIIVAVLILGVVIGGVAAWLRHGKWRRTARRLEREVSNLRREVDALKHAGAPTPFPGPVDPPPRLQLKAPAQ